MPVFHKIRRACRRPVLAQCTVRIQDSVMDIVQIRVFRFLRPCRTGHNVTTRTYHALEIQIIFPSHSTKLSTQIIDSKNAVYEVFCGRYAIHTHTVNCYTHTQKIIGLKLQHTSIHGVQHGRPKLSRPRALPVIVGWFTGRTWENN